MKRTLLFAFLVSVLSFQAPGTALACSCLQQSLQESIDGADAIFSGTIDEIEQSGDFRFAVSIRVNQSWKGLESKEENALTVYTGTNSAMCGYGFVEGDEYLVYANRGEETDEMRVSLCSATKPLEEAGKDIALLSADDSMPFKDVSMSHENADAIEYVQTEGIVQGYPDGTFRPDQLINRAEFTKIITLAFYQQAEINKCEDHYFFDVPADAWYDRYLCQARDSALLTGYPDGSFRPAAHINFVEAAKILVKAFDPLSRYELITTPDVEPPWYAYPVSALSENNAIPTSITGFDQPITRGEMAEMMYRLQAGVTNKPSKTYESLQGNAEVKTESTVDYSVRYNLDTGKKFALEEEYNGTIEARNRTTGATTVLVKSIKDAIPELRETWNRTIEIFAQPADGSHVIFKTVLKETDNNGGTLYSFDPKTLVFTKMKINDVYDGFFGGFAMSPDKSRFVWIENTENGGDAKTMILADLTNDTYRTLLTLPSDQTFNGGGYALSALFDVAWLDNATVQYALWEQPSKKSLGNFTVNAR